MYARTFPHWVFVLGLGLALTLFGLGANAWGQVAPRPLLFRSVRIFDGREVQTGDVLVERGKIQQVGVVAAPPKNAEIVEGKGKMLLPGLIDAHIHAGEDEGTLRQGLIFGVTLGVDLFGPPDLLRKLRKLEEKGEATGQMDLRGSGILATAPGGHGTEYGIPIPTVGNKDQAQAFVDARLAEGSDLIKIVYDHNTIIKMPTLAQETLEALVQATHKRGRLCIVHIDTQKDALESVLAGADGLAHGFSDELPSQELLAAVARRKVFVVPNLSSMAHWCGLYPGPQLAADRSLAPYLSEAVVKALSPRMPLRAGPPCLANMLKGVALLRQAGARILAGTDANNRGRSMGVSMHGELSLLVETGMSPKEALMAATSSAAEQFGLPDRGRIAKGMRADLVLIDGDATVDILATRRIVGVWKLGVAISRPLASVQPR